MKHRPLSLIIVLSLMVVGSVGFFATHRQGTNAVTMTTARVTRGSITTSVSGTGVLQPLTTVAVKSNVGGTLVSLGVEEGDRVHAGQIVARIDPADAQSTLDQSLADQDSSQAKVLQAQQNLSMQREQNTAQLHAAEQAVVSARVRLAQAVKQVTLQKAQTVAAIEQAQQNLASAQARLKQADDQATLQPQLTDMAIAQAKSALVSATSALQQMKNSTIPQKLAAARSALNQAKANYTYAQTALARQQQLLTKGYVARSEVDAAEQQFAVASAQRESAQQTSDTIADETREDMTTAQARVEEAEAAVQSAQANRTQDGLKQQDVLAARATVKGAESALHAAEANRLQDTVKNDDVASAQAALQQAEATLDNTKAQVYQTAIKEGDITQAAAQLKRSTATVSNAQTQLGYTTITAPRDGVVVKKYVEKGSVVAGARNSMADSGSGVTLLDIADVSQMYALVNIDETDIAKIRVGQEVDVTVDAFPTELFTGTVTRIAPQTTTTQNVTTIPVTVEVAAPDLRLKPGMNATCDFVTEKRENVLTVPSTAVKRSGSSASVTVIDLGKPLLRQVQTGLSGNNATEIREGLQEGEVVVTATHDPTSAASTPTSTKSSSARSGGGPPPPF